MVTLAFSVALGFYAKNTAAQAVTAQDDSDNAIRQAVQNAVREKGQGILGFVVNTVEVKHIFYAKDGRTAVVWLIQRDQFSGDIIGREPSMAIARNPAGMMASTNNWEISFETPNTMNNLLNTLPGELITSDMTQRYTGGSTLLPSSTNETVFSGYKLPFSTALRIKITGSVGHFLDYNSCAMVSCRYAYDFWNPDGSNRMFPLLASKGGIVVAAREGCSNGDSGCTNYLVLQDNSTTPTTYQLYYHLANNSIPDNVAPGNFVQQGQYIGNTDDTGYSSDHHLHFHVYTAPTSANYAWGNSVRILFSDVPFNGGEPRTCAETVNYPSYGTECSAGPDGKKLTGDDDYLQSGNVGTQMPSGALDIPFAWTTLNDKTLDVSGTATDALGITKVDVMVNYDGTWRNIASADYRNGVFNKAVDLCAAKIPNGPVSVAVRIWNLAGNWAEPLTGVRQIFNNAHCGNTTPQVPACSPGSNEVALYTEPGYYGSCQKFTAGAYTSSQLGVVGDNNAASIQVGSNVRAVLYDQAADLNAALPSGRLESFNVTDANLADNRIGAFKASALWVMSSTDIANSSVYEPRLTFPGNSIDSDHNSGAQPNPANPKSSDSLVLTWTAGRGATLFTAKLEKDGKVFKSMAAQNTQSWSVGSLPAGTYTWTVTACSGTTTCTGAYYNSSTLIFSVDAAALPTGGQVDSPNASFDMEGGAGSWTASGLWRWGNANRLQSDLSTSSTKAWIFNNGTNYNNAPVRAGDLTSPPIRINSAGSFYLHFRFFSGVEGPAYAGQIFASQHWDQRRVQVSIDNGPFTDIYSLPSSAPLSDDTQNTAAFWPNSPDIPLGSLTTGQIVRVRFHFDTVDEYSNDLYGWAIDDVSIDTNTTASACSDLNNDSSATATPLTFDGVAYNSRICPKGDVDYYSFSAGGGTPVRIQVDAKSSNSLNPLDSFIQLLDTNGRDVLAANDDLDTSNAAAQYRDSLIQTTLPRTGTYYIRVKAWDYPGSGGTDYTYKLSVGTGNTTITHPVVKVTKPASSKQVPVVPFIVEASVNDTPGSSIQRVDFYWHSKDWTTDKWTKFATDTNGSDGWWSIFNPTMDMTGGAFYIMATNNAGGTGGAALTDIAPDTASPTSTMLPLPETVDSTVVKLNWTTADSDIDHFEFQYRLKGSTTWIDWPTQPAGYLRSAWFVGQPGSYEFHMRAVDSANNQQAYPATAEASTTFTGACVDDGFEPANNSRTTVSSPLSSGELRQMILCQNDQDWVSFSATKDQALILLFPTLDSGASLHARLFDPSGSTVLAEGSSTGAGMSLVMRWTAPETGTYSIQISANDPAIYGSDIKYGVAVGPGKIFYFPIVRR